MSVDPSPTEAVAVQPAAPATGAEPSPVQAYRMAPLIRLTLVLLYLALVLPLPFLAPQSLRPAMTVALPLGLSIVLAISSEQVELDARGLRVGHPRWCSWWLRRGWSLAWADITGLTPVGTSQGGRVFYVRDRRGGAHLLPQRVERFPQFLNAVQQHSGLDLSSVARLSPAWTYQLLVSLCLLMLAGEAVALVRLG